MKDANRVSRLHWKVLKDFMNHMTIYSCNFSTRTKKCLEAMEIKNIFELSQQTAENLMKCRNFGFVSLSEVREKLSSYGLHLVGDLSSQNIVLDIPTQLDKLKIILKDVEKQLESISSQLVKVSIMIKK